MTGRVKKRGLLGRLAGPFALCGALISAGPAFGQNATGSTTGGGAPGSAPESTTTAATATNALQEVVVTAERRATDIQTTPISIVAISGNELQSAHINSEDILQQTVPNLSINQTGGFSNVMIRGMGNESDNSPISPGVITVHDGAPSLTPGLGLDTAFYDIADVEVLRGPQGTFIGDNSTGGAILITSQNPNFRGINGYIDAGVATYSDQKLNGAVNLPVSETFAMRLAFNEEQRNSFSYDEGSQYTGPYLEGPYVPAGTYSNGSATLDDPGNLNEKNMRLSLLWKPSDNFQSLTKIEINNEETDGLANQPDLNTFQVLPGLGCPSGLGKGPSCHSLYYSDYSGSPYVLNTPSLAQKWNENDDQYTEQLNYTLPSNVTLRSTSGLQEINAPQDVASGAGSANIGYTADTYFYHIYNEEIDALSPTTGPLTWIAGATWIYMGQGPQKFAVDTASPYSAATPSISYYGNHNFVWQRAEGVFGHMSWQFLRTLQFDLGVRENWDNKATGGCSESVNTITDVASCTVSPYPFVSSTPTGKVGLNWTPLTGQYFYLFFARGYKPGQENIGGLPSTKETVNDYELGWKGQLANGHLATQLGGYYMDYYNLNEGIFDPYNVHGSNINNVPFSVAEGIEASMRASVGQLGFNLAAAINKSKLGSLEDVATYKFPSGYGTTNQCTPAQITAGTPLTVCTNYIPYEVNLSGESLPYAPELTASATLQYRIPLGSTYLQPRVRYSYTGSQYASLFQTDNFFLMNAYSLWSGYLDWIAGPWTTTIYGTNLANKLYLAGISGTTSSTTVLYGNPRQYGLEINRTF